MLMQWRHPFRSCEAKMPVQFVVDEVVNKGVEYGKDRVFPNIQSIKHLL